MPTSSNVPMPKPTSSDPQSNNHQHSSPHADTHPESPRSSLPSPPSSPSSSFSSIPSSIFSLSLPSSSRLLHRRHYRYHSFQKEATTAQNTNTTSNGTPQEC
ncbi:hypothetical protein M422DRAFT_32802 [Sphaerobolus stellatus SS14]|uniref:Uncharacterized protein n=1 Tax=Sphaerobolus stellatus (strain SS14) TaxID=990650 RepID=A0A0C9VMF4_SPHS4|nr:hypothetical protein M422DRAFT_32802 [Sphaerobolus stellatus SS14]